MINRKSFFCMFALEMTSMKYFSFLVLLVFLVSCNHQTRDKLIQNDEFTSQNILNDKNPYRIRDSVKFYAVIPDVSLNAKLKIYKSLIDSLSNSYKSEENNKFSNIEKYNYLIIKYIIHLVENHNVYPNVLAKEPIKFFSSANKRIGIFSWDEHTGLTMKSNINILVYKTRLNKMKAIHLEWINSKEEVLPYAGRICNIFLLKSNKDKQIYMVQTRGETNANCQTHSMFGLAITNDTIDLKYPLFGNKNEYFVETNDSLNSKFKYLPAFSELQVEYSPFVSNNDTLENKAVRVRERWIFKDEKFELINEITPSKL